MTDFEELVSRMRDAQKMYFRTRGMDVLKQSKELEKQVDAHIRSIMEQERRDAFVQEERNRKQMTMGL